MTRRHVRGFVGAGLVLALAGVALRGGSPTLAAPALISSPMSGNVDGWTTVGATAPVAVASGGNPGGYASATDVEFGPGNTWYWLAPAKYIGDKSAYYNTTIEFSLKQSKLTGQTTASEDLVLLSGGIKLTYNLTNPDLGWTTYRVTLNEQTGWIDSATGLPPTRDRMQQVLANLTALRIRGDYSDSADTTDLDTVVMGRTPFSNNVYLPLVTR